MNRSWSFLLLLIMFHFSAAAQSSPGRIVSVKLFPTGDQTGFPLLTLGATEGLELHFDDLEGGVKNFYYGLQLCNADWSPSVLRPFEYIRGFPNIRISNYRASSLSSTRYTHYQASVPDRSSYPLRSGNYLLKVFLNGDTSKLSFTHRMVVVEPKSKITAQVQQPLGGTLFRSHQKLQIGVATDNRVQVFSPQDLKVVILQNNNWRSSMMVDRPTIYRGNYYEYSDEAYTSFQAGKEWRWVDLRSFRLLSDRVKRMDTRGDTTQIYVKPDGTRNGQVYVYYRDINGAYAMETLESINPLWQSEYANVHFSFQPAGGRRIEGQDVYLFGELTQYARDSSARMEYNADKGIYEKTLFLKQGYYNYNYITLPQKGAALPDYSSTEGNNWSTQNVYTVLVYYRPFGARADELIGAASLNSLFGR